MNPAHNQLAVMEGRNATTCAGQLGPVKQNQVTIEEANAAHGITRHGDVALIQRVLPKPAETKLPFFALIASGSTRGSSSGTNGEERWLAARGRGGGLALWRS